MSQKINKIDPLIIGFEDIIPCNSEIESKLLPGRDSIAEKLNNFLND